MNLYKCSYWSLSKYANKLRTNKTKKPYSQFNNFEPFEIHSPNNSVNGIWTIARLRKNLKHIKGILSKTPDFKSRLEILKGYTKFRTREAFIKGRYQRARKKKHACPENTLCGLCRKNTAPYYHHIQLIKNGGSNYSYNLLPICPDCHEQVHQFLIQLPNYEDL